MRSLGAGGAGEVGGEGAGLGGEGLEVPAVHDDALPEAPALAAAAAVALPELRHLQGPGVRPRGSRGREGKEATSCWKGGGWPGPGPGTGAWWCRGQSWPGGPWWKWATSRGAEPGRAAASWREGDSASSGPTPDIRTPFSACVCNPNHFTLVLQVSLVSQSSFRCCAVLPVDMWGA